MTRIRPVLFATLLAVSAAGAEAATYYVSPAGADSSNGSSSAPFRTISHAATVARPGDIVEVRGGVYEEIVKIRSRGTANARITFRSFPGERAVIDGSGTAAKTDLVQISGAEFVDFAGFEVRNSTRLGIAGWGASNIQLVDNIVHDSTRGGIYFGYSGFGSARQIVIQGNTVFNNVLENQYHTMNGGWGQSIGVQYADGVRIADNRVYENDGEGIGVVLSNNVVVQRNTVYDNFSVQIYLDNARQTTLDANLVYSTGNTRYYRRGHPAHGISAANEQYSSSNPLSDILIKNNIVVGCRSGFFYGSYERGGGLKNVVVANNTFHGSTGPMLLIDNDAHANTAILNNVFHQVGGAALTQVGGGGIAYGHNNWWGGTAGAASGAGDVIGDPAFANPGGLRSDDYQITSASPLVAAGAIRPEVVHDHWLSPRVQRNDIGAHQSVSLSGGGGATTPTPPPTTPTPPPTTPTPPPTTVTPPQQPNPVPAPAVPAKKRGVTRT